MTASRIAALVPAATEMLFALGLGDEVVGVTHECDYPPAAAGLPRVTSTVIPPDLSPGEIDAAVKRLVGEGKALFGLDEERLAALRPDLIVTQAVCEVCAVSYEDVAKLAARLPGSPPVVQQDPSTLGEMLEDITRLGEAAGVDDRAARLRGELEGRVEWVREAVAAAERPRVVALEWLEPPFVGGHWLPEMISIAGGEDVAGPAGAKSPEVTWGDLEALRPEVALAIPCGYYLEGAREQALTHWDKIEALGAGRIFAVDAASTYSRPGPRLVDGLELLAHLFHPDLVDPPPGIEFAQLKAPAHRRASGDRRALRGS